MRQRGQQRAREIERQEACEVQCARRGSDMRKECERKERAARCGRGRAQERGGRRRAKECFVVCRAMLLVTSDIFIVIVFIHYY